MEIKKEIIEKKVRIWFARILVRSKIELLMPHRHSNNRERCPSLFSIICIAQVKYAFQTDHNNTTLKLSPDIFKFLLKQTMQPRYPNSHIHVWWWYNLLDFRIICKRNITLVVSINEIFNRKEIIYQLYCSIIVPSIGKWQFNFIVPKWSFLMEVNHSWKYTYFI